MTITVSVKWQKELFQDVEIDTSQPPLVFKGQLYALTGVPPERQKIMVKGGVLQDYADWSKAAVKKGQRLMMMGTADEIPVAPTNAPVFVEDLPEEDQEDAMHRGSSTAGLVNLGNTCYMNATLQCLHAVPELKSAVSGYSATGAIPQDSSHLLALATKDLFSQMGASMRPVTPLRFLQILRQRFPQFAQMGQRGMFMQQDAEECWTQLLQTLYERLRSQTDRAHSVVSQLFGVGLRSHIKCEESGEENSEEETTLSLKCHISSDVNQLSQGMKTSLIGELEKKSEALGRETVFKKTSEIVRLPRYLTVQFVRFFWKRESQQKAKILRKVGFPLLLDLYEFCSPELQKELEGPRKRHREEEDRKAMVPKPVASGPGGKAGEGDATVEGMNGEAAAPPSSAAEGSAPGPPLGAAGAADPPAGTAAAETNDGAGVTQQLPVAEDGATAAVPQTEGTAADVEMADGSPLPAEAGGSRADGAQEEGELTGLYELIGVLTHKGRSADSGHYVAWVKQHDGKWVEFDDDRVVPRREEEITNLCGGGDWHMAYILLFKARTVASGAKKGTVHCESNVAKPSRLEGRA